MAKHFSGPLYRINKRLFLSESWMRTWGQNSVAGKRLCLESNVISGWHGSPVLPFSLFPSSVLFSSALEVMKKESLCTRDFPPASTLNGAQRLRRQARPATLWPRVLFVPPVLIKSVGRERENFLLRLWLIVIQHKTTEHFQNCVCKNHCHNDEYTVRVISLLPCPMARVNRINTFHQCQCDSEFYGKLFDRRFVITSHTV